MCTVRATGKLTNVKMHKLDPVGPYETFVNRGQRPRNTGPELEDGQQRKQVRKALDEGENVEGEGHRQGDGCGRQRGDREAHDHTRQVGTTRE